MAKTFEEDALGVGVVGAGGGDVGGAGWVMMGRGARRTPSSSPSVPDGSRATSHLDLLATQSVCLRNVQ